MVAAGPPFEGARRMICRNAPDAGAEARGSLRVTEAPRARRRCRRPAPAGGRGVAAAAFCLALALAATAARTTEATPGEATTGETPAAPPVPDATTSDATTSDATSPGTAEAIERKRERENELAELGRALDVSRERQAELAAEIEAIDKDRATLNQTLIATARRISVLEQATETADRRLSRLRGDEAAMRLSLADRRGVLIEILAALERFGRDPPPAIVVSPQDARTALKSALLLAATLPEVRVQAEALAADLAALDRLVAAVDEQRATLLADLAELGEERQRIALLVEEKRKLRTDQRDELATEQLAAEGLADRARSLRDLVASIEREIAAARTAAEAASRAGDGERPAAADTDRLSPAIAFADTRGTLPLPVGGIVAAAFGDPDGEGGQRQGVTIACPPGAQVIAPVDGWVVYAGPFRSYRQILILNVGDAYHIVLAGLDRIDVGLGQFVLAGEPVGLMGSGAASPAALPAADPAGAAATDVAGSDLYVEFRRGGTAVDPAPWWAARLENEVRG